MENLSTSEGEVQRKLVGAYGNKGKGREREIIPVPEGMVDPHAVMVLFKCDYLTAKATLKRGYYIVDYLKRSICPGPLDPEAGYKMAWYVYHRKFKGKLPWYLDAKEVVQEGVVMLLEMAGHARFQERKFQYYVAFNGMQGFIDRQRRLRGARIGPEETPGYEEVYRQDAGATWLADWQAERQEAPQKAKASSPDTWGRAHRATEKICRVIAAKGIAPMDLAA
jgi:hypothetical protein